MPKWLPRVLKRIHELAASGELRLTYKAEREVLMLGLALEDVRDVVSSLSASDAVGRFTSLSTGEWMYLFKPDVGGQVLYVKIVLRENCRIVSFHEDEGHEEDG